MAAMAQERCENGRIKGLGGMASAAFANEVRDYEAKLAARARLVSQETSEPADRPENGR